MNLRGSVFTPLDIPHVILEICKNLSIRDLLRFSFVNRSWLLACRTVLRDSRPSIFSTYPGKACERLKQFETALSRQSLPFINGISIRIKDNDHHRHGKCYAKHDKDGRNVGDILFAKLKIQFIEIHWLGAYRYLWRCPAVQLALKCIRERPQDILYIRLEHLPSHFQLFPAQIPLIFPNLRTIKSFRLSHDESHQLLLLRRILEGAPNLNEYDIQVNKRDLRKERIPVNKFQILTNLYFQPAYGPVAMAHYERLAASQPKLRELVADTPKSTEIPIVVRGWECLRQLVESSANTLTTVRTDALVLLMLEDLGVPPLKSVKHLTISVPRNPNGERLREVLSLYNLSALFPAVRKAKIVPQYHYRMEFDNNIYQKFHITVGDCSSDSVGRISATGAAFAASAAVVSKIKKIKLGYCSEPPFIPVVMDIFRDNVIHVEAPGAKECRHFWKWPGLKVATLIQSTGENLDAEFCGIFSAEAKWLREQSKEFLKAYQAVPVRQAIYHNTNLPHVKDIAKVVIKKRRPII